MARYIDADKLKTRIAPESDFRNTLSEWIDLQETEDVTPVIHARWIHRTAEWNFTEECSKCHFGHDYRTPFCPICGAKMDEEV